MESIELGKFIVQLINKFWERITFFTVCDKGQAVIRKRLGYPIKWRTKPKLYWKWPLIDVFDKVDVREKYAQFNAHSFNETQNKSGILIPYNILIDFQAEYQIVNPLGIYEAYGLRDNEDIIVSYIGNIIHSQISQLIKNKGTDLLYNDVVSLFETLPKELKIMKYTYNKEKEFDDTFCERNRTAIEIKDCISINNVVLTSFDKNISIRTTV